MKEYVPYSMSDYNVRFEMIAIRQGEDPRAFRQFVE